MTEPNINALHANSLLQSIINIIDQKSFWEKHYFNLIKLEDDETKTYQKHDPLNQLSITEFLKFEKKVYGFTENADAQFKNTLEQLEEIEKFIPRVFNFKERLKLTLCAVCHMDIDGRNVDLNGLFKKFENLKLTMKTTLKNQAQEPSNKSGENKNGLLEVYRKKKEEVENTLQQHAKMVKKSSEKRTTMIKKRLETPRSKRMNGPQTGGSASDESYILINELFGENKNYVEFFNKAYQKLGDDEDNTNAIRGELFQHLSKLAFSNMNKRNDHHKLKTLNDAFIQFIDKQQEENLSKINEKIKALIKKPDFGFNNYKEYLKDFYDSSREPINENKNKLCPKTKEEFDDIYKGTPVYDFVEEKVANGNKNSSFDSQSRFNTYNKKIFEYMYAKILKEGKYLEEAIKEQEKELASKNRERDDIETEFLDEKNPLLRMFLMLVFECIHCLSDKSFIAPEKFWEHLEQNIGNGISIEDETFMGNDSLFTYLETELKKREDGEETVEDGEEKGEEGEEKGEKEEKGQGIKDKIKRLINKAKLIYLLQNYYYF